jgi:hypothetical protein
MKTLELWVSVWSTHSFYMHLQFDIGILYGGIKNEGSLTVE